MNDHLVSLLVDHSAIVFNICVSSDRMSVEKS
jgi:hypothetical protein